MKVAQFIIGPAGSGKSTFAYKLSEHFSDIKRRVIMVNFDPAAEEFQYTPDIDIRDMISVTDVMEDDEYSMGPNGGLVFCMQYMLKNLDWLLEKLDESCEYVIFDCPGQIELYTHLTEFKTIFDNLARIGFVVCIVYLLDCHYMLDPDKYIGSVLWAMSSMVQFEVPHINVVTKVDMLSPSLKNHLEQLLEQSGEEIMANGKFNISENFIKLNNELAKIIDNYSVVSFYGLDYDEDTCIEDLLCIIDGATQYGEDQEVQEMDIEM